MKINLINSRFNTIFSKLLLRYLLISLLVIVILGFSMIYFFTDYHYSQKEEDIIANSQIVEEYISKALYLQDRYGVESWLEIISRMNNGQAWLINRSGYLTMSYPEPGPFFTDESHKFIHYEKIFSGEIVSQQIDVDQFREPMLLIGLPVRFYERIDYGLLIFTPVSGIKDTVDQVKKLMLYSSLFAILLGGLLAYTWSRSLSKPLKKISDFAINLGDGDFGKTIEIDKKDLNKNKKENNKKELIY